MSRRQPDEHKRSGYFYRGLDPNQPNNSARAHLQAAASRLETSMILAMREMTPEAQLVFPKIVTAQSIWAISMILVCWHIDKSTDERLRSAIYKITGGYQIDWLATQYVDSQSCEWLALAYTADSQAGLGRAATSFAAYVSTGGVTALGRIALDASFPGVQGWLGRKFTKPSTSPLWGRVMAGLAKARTAEAVA